MRAFIRNLSLTAFLLLAGTCAYGFLSARPASNSPSCRAGTGFEDSHYESSCQFLLKPCSSNPSLVGLPGAAVSTQAGVPDLRTSSHLTLAARLHNGYFQVPQDSLWRTVYVAGVDIGPAMPGHFATEPPSDPAVYTDWFDKIGAMGANAIRVYTLLPPGFYHALLDYDRAHPQQPLYLFQEIWLEDPLDGNLFDSGFTAAYQKAVRDVVDAMHGDANIPPRPAHASGIFSADVSPYVMGWVIGREIEPHVEVITNARHPEPTNFTGRFLSIQDANATELWLTMRMDETLQYEASQYHWQRPICFVNWPPLDPLKHPSTMPQREEMRLREKELGQVFAPLTTVPDDLDVVSLDEEKITPLPDDPAGYFAMYHIYPTYPDFIFLDPAYQKAKDDEGPNAYWGYLQALRAHYRKTPVLVGEYGLSTSIGIAHFSPDGMNHGGFSELQQGKTLARLTVDIEKAGYAGGIIFEWIDEWWKHNWIAADFEIPFERKPLWHNDLDPEQSYGLMKFVPANHREWKELWHAPAVVIVPGHSVPPDHIGKVVSVQASWDPSALYLNLKTNLPPGEKPDWSKVRYFVALNTCGVPCGSGLLATAGDVEVEDGANFLVAIRGPNETKLLIARNYNPYRKRPLGKVPGITTVEIPPNLQTHFDPSGSFEEQVVETNRRIYGENGSVFPSVTYTRSPLHYGNFSLRASDYDSLGQFFYDASRATLRLRLSWGLLLALDPSEGLVCWGTDSHGKPFGNLSREIRIAVVSAEVPTPGAAAVPFQIVAARSSGEVIDQGLTLPWPTWSYVSSEAILKQSYPAVEAVFRKITAHPFH